MQDGYIFYRNGYASTSLCDYVIWEKHVGLGGQFGCDETITMLEDMLYWPSCDPKWLTYFRNTKFASWPR